MSEPTFDVTILDPRAEFLRDKGKNITSQFGEDGYIQALFERIGVTNKWCFEVGAHDGLYLSNTKWMRDAGWNAVLIESEIDRMPELEKHASDKVHVTKAWLDTGLTLDTVLDGVRWEHKADIPDDLDFGCIDIDGQDYYVWLDLVRYRPRVMLVEFSPYQEPEFLPKLNGEGQAGLVPIVNLARAKGYIPLLHSYCNLLAVREDAWK